MQETTEKTRKMQEKFRTTQSRQKNRHDKQTENVKLTLENMSFYMLHRLRELAKVSKARTQRLDTMNLLGVLGESWRSGVTDCFDHRVGQSA